MIFGYTCAIGLMNTETMSNFASCEICGESDWALAYCGPVRDGAFGSVRENALVGRCGYCGVERLAEEVCIPSSFYETDAYRSKLQQELDSESYFSTHDELQIHTLKSIWPASLRGKTIAEIGCAAGSLLDHLRGYTCNQIAIEPYDAYREGLAARGYRAYPYASDAVEDWAEGIDLAFSIQVIEHTVDPRAFLEEIRPLLAPGGKLVISTPNRRDILFDLLPQDFPSFFYRVVHRWYFDAASLANCARMAGYKVVQMRHIHRYGMANAFRWLRDRQPGGHDPLSGIDALADSFWCGYLEQSGRADCLFMVLEPSAS
jgi:SAM-dependent methyltransferase